jgi:hypothetical protein
VTGDLLRHTLPVFGYSYKHQDSVQLNENVLRFKEHFGVEPATVAAVLNNVKTEYPKEFNIKDALVSFHWLKCYGTERTIAGP